MTTKIKHDRFRRGSGAYTCRLCGKLTRETGSSESSCGLCLSCFDQAGLENEHNDGGHDGRPVAECSLCVRKEGGA